MLVAHLLGNNSNMYINRTDMTAYQSYLWNTPVLLFCQKHIKCIICKKYFIFIPMYIVL
jgi:hypothetical protein